MKKKNRKSTTTKKGSANNSPASAMDQQSNNENSTEPIPIYHTYKDRLFRMVFREKKELLELYNALRGTHYTNPDDLTIVTLENAIYMGMKNDLAFVFMNQIMLYEHQSTVNPNLPLRDLFYIADEFQKLVANKSLYTTTLVTLPTPHFVVL